MNILVEQSVSKYPKKIVVYMFALIIPVSYCHNNNEKKLKKVFFRDTLYKL